MIPILNQLTLHALPAQLIALPVSQPTTVLHAYQTPSSIIISVIPRVQVVPFRPLEFLEMNAKTAHSLAQNVI